MKTMKARYVLKSRCIFDSVSEVPMAGGIVIQDGKIVGTFPEEELLPYLTESAKVIDYGHRTILPGFIDSHVHMGNFMEMTDPEFCVDVAGSKTFLEVIEKIKAFGEKNKDAVLYAINFNLFDLEDQFVPDAKAIDQYISDRPVMIMTWDCHTWYVNSKALEEAGITKDLPDPTNSIEKDASGELTGVLNDTAVYPLQMLLVRPLEARKKSLARFLSQINAAGITTVGDVFPCGVTEPYPLYQSMEQEGQLTTRICFYPPLLDFNKAQVEALREQYCSDMLRFSGLKAILDGVLTVHTAWMLEPYSNKKDTCGGPVIDAQKLESDITRACGMGINCRVHAIGDAAIRFTLDCYEKALRKYGPISRRHTVEHIEYCAPADVPRFGQLGVVADMHPCHLTFYIDDALDYLGQEREAHTWLFRDVLNSGGIIGTGSDYPVVHFNPMLGIYAAVTRANDNGHPAGGWHPEQKLSIAEILKIYTIGSAMALNIDADTGTLETGKSADITVLDRNIFTASDKEILDIKPVMTMTAGNIVYQQESLVPLT
ncbi:hypothetical protein D3Z38_04680 [Clostridiales bacterium]|nr:hypothetical protein [Clostridiales bacterium]